MFVIEHVDELGDEAANRMLKTLEEPASFVHLILLTTRLVEVLPTIALALPAGALRRALDRSGRRPGAELTGVDRDTALACARLSLGDAEQAMRAGQRGGAPAPRRGREVRARCVVGRGVGIEPVDGRAGCGPGAGRGDANRARGPGRRRGRAVPRKERKRIETEWSERIRRVRRRVETGALDLALQVVSLWYADLACLAWGADELVRNSDRLEELRADSGVDAAALRGAVELVEDTRVRFALNVSEELACEALAYRLERLLAL